MLELLFIGFILFILLAAIQGIMEIKVKKISSLYNNILEINKTTYFHDLEPIYPIITKLNSKKDFDNYEFEDLIHETINREHEMSKIDMIFNQSKKNKNSWIEYNNKLDDLDLNSSDKDSKKTWMPNYIYKKIETKLIKQDKFKKPVISPIFRLYKTYTSPKGRNQYKATKDYTQSDISYHRKYLKEKEEKEIEYKKSAAYQRRLMTPSLRYDILKRDQFKCQICGYSQEDGVKLHVDHIVPVAKGGKTNRNNLRTLCEDCNLGKSYKYDPQGVN